MAFIKPYAGKRYWVHTKLSLVGEDTNQGENCGCRDIPEKIKVETKKKGIKF